MDRCEASCYVPIVAFMKRISSFSYLITTQFLVTLNDSIFRLVVTYSLIDLLGVSETNEIVALSAALFVLPFLLFSMPSGQLADRFSKKSVIIWTLWAEIVFMLLGLFAIFLKNPFFAYFALFLIALQSAVFNPPKYAIIAELEAPEKLSKANGIITLSSYLSIILGTFLASFILDLTNRSYVFVVILCIIFSTIALFTGYAIEKTPVKNPNCKISLLFVRDVFRSLKIAAKKKHLLLAIFAAAFFLYIAAYTQLNLIPFGIQSLGITDVQTGYVYLAAALGIGVGSILVALLSGKTIELGLSIWGAFGVGISYLLLYVFQSHLFVSCLLFFSIGMHGGLYVVPLDAYIQYASPEEDRGSIVAASLFLSFAGVLFSAATIALLGDVFSWNAATGFLWIGFFTIVFAAWVLFSLVEYVARLFAVIATKFFFSLEISEETIPTIGVISLKESSLVTLFSLVFCMQQILFIQWVSHKPSKLATFFYRVFNRIPVEISKEGEIRGDGLSRLLELAELGYSFGAVEKNQGVVESLARKIGQSIYAAEIVRKNNIQNSFFHFFRIIHPTVLIRFKLLVK